MKRVHNDGTVDQNTKYPTSEIDQNGENEMQSLKNSGSDAEIVEQKELTKGKNYPEKTTADGQPIKITMTTFNCPICYKELTTRTSKKFKRECLKTHILAEHTDSDLKFVSKFKNVQLPKII